MSRFESNRWNSDRYRADWWGGNGLAAIVSAVGLGFKILSNKLHFKIGR